LGGHNFGAGNPDRNREEQTLVLTGEELSILLGGTRVALKLRREELMVKRIT